MCNYHTYVHYTYMLVCHVGFQSLTIFTCVLYCCVYR